MWTLEQKNGEQSPADGELLTAIRPSLRRLFADVHRFILQAVNGDRATAETLFEDYLDGNLSEELLAVSRGWVSADQADSSNRNVEEEWCSERGALKVSDDALTTAA